VPYALLEQIIEMEIFEGYIEIEKFPYMISYKGWKKKPCCSIKYKFNCDTHRRSKNDRRLRMKFSNSTR